MLTAEARVETDRASRYLVQLCRHASQLGRHRGMRLPAHRAGDPQASQEMPAHIDAEWSDDRGTVSVDGGTCTMQATADMLTLRVEAVGEDGLQQIQNAITRDLTRFSRRNPLAVNWTRSEPPSPQLDEPGRTIPAPAENPTKRQGRRRAILLAVVAAVAVAAHVIAVVLAAPQWTGWAADVVLAVIVVKVILIAGHVMVGRRISRHRQDPDT